MADRIESVVRQDGKTVVSFTKPTDMSGLPEWHGLHDPEESKTPQRKVVEKAISDAKAADRDKSKWPKAKDVAPIDGWQKENADCKEKRNVPDDLDDPSEPNPDYKWVPGEEIPTLNGTPSSDQTWDICFSRVGRHLAVSGTDNTYASKINRMIRKRPLRFNEKGKEGWSFGGISGFGFEAFGPKCKLSLRGDCAGHRKAEEELRAPFLKAHRGESQGEEAYEPIRDNASADQWTTISGSRDADWCTISTNDNTVVTKIKKAAKGHPESWVVWRTGSLLIAYCPKGCVGFRA
jgi:hypothetical protein